MFPHQDKLDVGMGKAFQTVFPPGHGVDQRKGFPVVFGVARSAGAPPFFCEICVIPFLGFPLLANFRVAPQTPLVETFRRVAFVAGGNKCRPRHVVVGLGQIPGGGPGEGQIAHHQNQNQGPDQERRF